MRFWVVIMLGVCLAWSQARAECAGAPYDGFDFWLGTWNDPATPAAERYVVRRVAAGCVVEETLTGADGQVKGLGISGWDREQKLWRQFWADADGTVRLYTGGPASDGSVVLTSEPESDGVRWRYTYRNIGPTELDADYAWSNGHDTRWTKVWSGHYVRVTAPDSPGRR